MSRTHQEVRDHILIYGSIPLMQQIGVLLPEQRILHFNQVVLTVTTYYRRKVTDASCGNGYNNTVTVTVKPVFSVGTIGSNQTICIGTTPPLISSTASPSGGQGGYSYFWESSLNGTDFNSISGAFAETYQPGSLSQTTYYRRNVTDASCGNGYTNTVKITVRSDFFYGTIGSNQTIFYSSDTLSSITKRTCFWWIRIIYLSMAKI